MSLCLEGSSMAEAEAEAKAMSLCLEGSMAEAKAGSSSQAKRPTLAEAQALKKRLDSFPQKINDLTWRLDIEKFRSCFGDKTIDLIFPPESSGVRCRRRSPEDLELMSRCLDLIDEFENWYNHSCSSGISEVPKRLRKQDVDEKLSLSEEEEESQMPWPPYIKDLEKELSSLKLEYEQLYSEERAPDISGMTEAERAAEAERLREEAFQEASLLLEEGADIDGALDLQMSASFLDFDPKQGGMYYNRATIVCLGKTFDLFEESPIGPMRFTNNLFQGKKVELDDSINILSVKVAHSDVGFPIQVYGTVIVRDCIDYKCVYLFNRDREHCQLINSKDESLILTGPKRGLLLVDENYVETDLMIRDHEGQDRELSKGVLIIRGIAGRSLKKCEVEYRSLATRLSTVELAYAVVISALEATISIEVEEGEFCGRVTAHTTSIKNRLVLYDGQLTDHMPGNGRGFIKMMRRVISVHMKDMLIINARIHGHKGVIHKCAPKISNVDEFDLTLGTAKMRLRVAWSVLDLA